MPHSSPGVTTPSRLSPSRLTWALVLFGSLLAASAGAQDPGYRIAPAPNWVERIEIVPDQEAPPGTSDGVYYLLSDMQLRAGPGPAVRYSRLASRALDAGGVTTIAQIEIGFDPSFQTLVLHHVDVIRDGRRQARLPTTEVKLLQREEDLEYRIYDGRKTATLFLEDVRAGDVVDYSFSVEGENPAFQGAIFGQATTQWSVPVGIDHTRVLIPHGRTVKVESRRGAAEPEVRDLGGHREYTWRQVGVPPLRTEDGTPVWLQPHGHVRWTEFADWAAVARWAAPFYPASEPIGAALEAQVAAIAREHATPEARAAAALRFVQSEIRYLGVEVGIGSYRPNPPRTVFERRFGDCKDKTLLLLALLSRLDVDAVPALVHSERGLGLEEGLVAPNAFDHVIVRARIGGRDYWLDPTRDTQSGRLDRLFQPDFGMALPVSAQGGALVAMHPQRETPRRRVEMKVDARKGMDAPAILTVTTRLESAAAENMRISLRDRPRQDIEKDYLNFYSNYYHGLRGAGPLEVRDEPEENRLVLVERYEVDDFWSAEEKNGPRVATVHAADMYDLLRAPAAPRRQMPLAISHPIDFTLTTEILLHDSWPVRDEDKSVASPGFRMDRSIRAHDGGRRTVIEDRYRSLADTVSAQDTPAHVARLEEARDLLGYEFTWRPPGSLLLAEGFNWTVAMLALVLLAGFAAVAVMLYRYDPPGPSVALDPALEGIGGWLVLPAIGAVLRPLLVAAALFMSLDAYTLAGWTSLTTPGDEAYHPLWAPVLLFELAANIGLIVLSLLVAVMFFQRRRLLPRLYIALLVAEAALGLVDYVLTRQIPAAVAQSTFEDTAVVVRSFISSTIWTSYFLLSRRVKSTFILTRRGRETAVPPPLPLPG